MIDCTILTYKDHNYLLPTLAIIQAIILPDHVVLKSNAEVAGYFMWQNQDKPIITLDMLPIGNAVLKHPKIALLHSMQPLDGLNDFAVLFTGQARRLKISHDNIIWADEHKHQAIVTEKKAHIEVMLANIAELSLRAKQLTAVSTKVAK